MSLCASGGMVDAQDLGSCVLRRVGSSPISRTKFFAYSVINNACNSGKSARKALPLCEIAFFSS